jgi:hypothetical protein
MIIASGTVQVDGSVRETVARLESMIFIVNRYPLSSRIKRTGRT